MTLDNLPLERPLVFFDLETTGVNVVSDRVVQIGALRYEPGGAEPRRYERLVHPGRPIPPEVTAIHGITDADVAAAPRFEALADELLALFDGADLGGYNVGKFDLPLLLEEFARCGRDFRPDGRRVVDALEIFFRMEPRTLAGALRFYCGEELTDAHDAMADIEATVKVLRGQLARYGPEGRLTPEVGHLHQLSTRPGQLDATNRLRRDGDGEIVFNFGKYRGRRAREVFRKEPSYYHWIQDRDFSVQVKAFTKELWESMQ